jgi:Domain of unknown function (DUF1996)
MLARASSRPRVRVAALVGLIATVVIAALSLFPTDPAPDNRALAHDRIGDEGWFHSDCRFSHRAMNDPIVHPGHAGASHPHDFIGNRGTGASSTNGSLRANPRSTCLRGAEEKDPTLPLADRSAYWTPTLLVDGRPLAPKPGVTAGYAVGPRDPTRIEPFPENLKMIAGTPSGAKPRVGKAIVYRVRCGKGRPLARRSLTTAPTCATPDLRVDINFPDCSNGRADSADHKSHMAYSQPAANGSGRWVCPRTHPTYVPQLNLKYRFATTGGPDVSFTTGDMSTAHADFMNGWDEERLAQLIRACLKADEYCGGGNRPAHRH